MRINCDNINMKIWIVLSFFVYFVSARLSNGDDCEGNKGKCILLKDCPSVMKAFRNGIHPKPCGFEQKHPLVCCPIINGITDRISQIKCRSYSAQNPSTLELRSDSSVVQVVGEFPHMAALGYKNKNNIIFLCGGSLISEQYILTAAHCLTSLQFGAVQIIRLGQINIGPILVPTSQYYKVKRYISHPSYKSPSMYHDIALIELEDSVQFNDFIKPACLYSNENIPFNVDLIVTGWGLTKYGRSNTDTLQKVLLHLFTKEECNYAYNSESEVKLNDGINYNSQFCVGDRTSSADTCQGDSGSPLQLKLFNENIYSIIGINSFQKMCGTSNVPEVYTKIFNYLTWIESIIWPSN